MNTRATQFYALCALLQNSGRRKHRSLAYVSADAFVRFQLAPVLRVAAKNFPEFDVEELIELCTPAWNDALEPLFER